MKARSVLAGLLALFALLTLIDRFVLLELLVRRTAIPLLFAILVAIACTGIGALARRTDEADAPLDFLIGYPLLGTVCFLVGLLKVNVWTMLPVVLLFAIAGGLLLLAGWKHSERMETHWSSPWAAPIVVLVLACGFVAAQAPPSSLDELAYHLAIPHTWVLEGRAIHLPLLSQSLFPLGIESADLPALTLLGASDGGAASHFLHLLAAIATTILIVRRTESWLATAAIITTPALAIAAGWSLVEWPLIGLFVVLFLAMERDDLRMASAATAAGFLTKYTFGPFAVLAWAIKRKRPHWITLAGLVFFVRNLVLTGNPVAPFLSADAPHVSGFRELALADYIFDSSFIDEALGAAMLILPAFALGALAVGCALLAIGLFLLAPSSRILLPYLVVPSMSGAHALKKKWLAATIGIAVVIQLFFVCWFTARGDAFSLLAGGVSEDQFLRKQRPAYASTAWLNTALPRDARTLVIGTNETFWFTSRVRGTGNFDGPRMSSYFDLPAPEAVRERMRQDGITHVAVITTPVPTKNAAKAEERQTNLTPSAQRMLVRTLDRYAGTVTSHGDTTLFTLR